MQDIIVISEEPVVEEAPASLPKKVSIYSQQGTEVHLGDTVTMGCVLEGFEDCEEVYYCWMADKGNGFEAIPGANEAAYSFVITEETIEWNWTLSVSYK